MVHWQAISSTLPNAILTNGDRIFYCGDRMTPEEPLKLCCNQKVIP